MDPSTPPDYDAEYDNRGRVPEHLEIFAAWGRDAEAWRAERPPETIVYGPGERTAADLFEGGDGPIVVFVHGGYWQAMHRSAFSHMARGANLRGVSAAIVGYDLCPAVTLAEIVEQVRHACRALWRRTGRPLLVTGHSAGGHLAACMLAHDWVADAEVGSDLVPSAVAISGLFDLEPLVQTRVNDALGLTPLEARRLSPAAFVPPAGRKLDAWVGADESAEYHRQSRDIVRAWGAAGVETRFGVIAHANHFTAIAGLADPDSMLVRRLLELRG